VERINNALADHNRKYFGRRCAFIYQDTRNRLSLGFVISAGTVTEYFFSITVLCLFISEPLSAGVTSV